MSIQPIDFLTQAKALIDDREIGCRSACSRAYYAVYHESLKHYSTVWEEGAQGGMHRRFIDGLMRSPDRKDKSLGYRLNKIYAKRIDADYKLGLGVSLDDAQQIIQIAELIFEQLDTA